MTDEVLRDYAAHPEAYRETPVVEGSWDWRDDLASAAWAQLDYDKRQLAARRSGTPTAPSTGWTFEDRVLARGMVDAVLARMRSIPAALEAVQPPEDAE